jgi:hypothetical protein
MLRVVVGFSRGNSTKWGLFLSSGNTHSNRAVDPIGARFSPIAPRFYGPNPVGWFSWRFPALTASTTDDSIARNHDTMPFVNGFSGFSC